MFPRTLHLVIQGRAADCKPDRDGRLPSGAAPTPLPVTFDEAYDRLADLPELFIEPDGAFLWSGWSRDDAAAPTPRWQWEGCLYDNGRQLHYVELRGHGGRTDWLQLIAAVAADPARISVQLVEQGEVWTFDAFTERVFADGDRKA